MSGRRAASFDALPAPLFFVVGAVSQYLGAALAVALFDRLGPVPVAWLRVAFSGVLLTAWRRPRPWQWSRSRAVAVALFGVALAAMNLCFYLAVERLPLGSAVAVEFTGPVAVAAYGARSRRGFAAVGLAAAGVLALADVRWQASAAGLGFALGAAALWAAYIVAGRRVAVSGNGLDGLAVSLLVGGLAVAPFGLVGLARAPAVDAAVIGGCALVGLASNVIPYGLDQVVLPRLRPSEFALLLALLPATAAVVGAVALGQLPRPLEALGIAAVCCAVLVGGRPAPAPG